MSYHVEAPRFGFKELPERILVREDGAYGASKEHGEQIIDHWYVPEQDAPQDALCARIDELCAENEKMRAARDTWQENDAKLRELADSSYTFAFNCYHGVFDQEAFFRLREKYRECGIEVPDGEV